MQTTILEVDKSAEIVTLEDCNEFQRITDPYDELVVSGCLDAAVALVERWINHKLYPTKVMAQEQDFYPEIVLSFPKVVAVDPIITAENDNLDEIELHEGNHWKFDKVTSSIKFKGGYKNTLDNYKNYRITYDCGYQSSEDVPKPIKHAILMTASTMYAFREDALTGTQINEVPLKAQNIASAYRIRAK